MWRVCAGVFIGFAELSTTNDTEDTENKSSVSGSDRRVLCGDELGTDPEWRCL
jgi:hypothetical protein